MTHVPEHVRIALARAFPQGPDPQGHRLQALLDVLVLAAAGNPIPSPATVRAGSLVRDAAETWLGAHLVAECGVFASDPAADELLFLPWHEITAFASAPPTASGANRSIDPVLP